MSIDVIHQQYPPLDLTARRELSQTVSVSKWQTGRAVGVTEDEVTIEQPLEIRVRGHSISVTMRTPGHDIELAAGFLLTEGLLRRQSDIRHAEHCGSNDDANVLNVLLGPEVAVDLQSLTRHVFASSSCGLCGKATIESLRRRFDAVASAVEISAAVLSSLPDAMRAEQAAFDRTGGLHAAALFNASGDLLVLREDVGRHNAVDKVIGHALLRDWHPLDAHVLLVSGRTSFEIVQKALAARIPIVASVSAPSSMAVELAAESGITLVGFLRGKRMNVYTHAERILPAPPESGR